MSILYRVSPHKALAVILWFAKKRPGIDFHSILKLLFYADKYHLNNYGRPIVGDRYVALPYGPVAQMTYDILRGEPLALEALRTSELPFEVRDTFEVHLTIREVSFDKLSDSDVEALQHAWDEYSHLDFNALTRCTHADPAYQNAEGQTIQYEDFLEDQNKTAEILEDLRETAPHLVF